MATESKRDLVLGTAGHIDHGKSTLVQALTGTDPDRLSEEKQRGITIELGFAQLELPDGSASPPMTASCRKPMSIWRCCSFWPCRPAWWR